MRQEPARNGKGKTVSIELVANLASSNGYKSKKQEYEFPASLKDAIKIYGEREVFKLFTDSLTIRFQAQLRNSMRPKKGARAHILDEIEEKV